MGYRVEKYGLTRKRRNFSDIRNTYELKDLLDVQLQSYRWFIEVGIKEVLEDLFPVQNFAGTLELEFGDYYFDEPKYTVNESKARQTTFSASLKAQVRLTNHETGEIKEQEIFLGDMPLMTENGTFINKGIERVVVSQLVRSPSVYFNYDIDKNGRELITAQIIPTRGTWLEFETDARETLYARIDRTRKVTLTTFLRAFGLSSDDDIKKMFGSCKYVENTLLKDSTRNTDEALIEIYEKLRPGEPATLDSAKNRIVTSFFSEFVYDLAKVGRYKFNKKLSVLERLLGQTIAEDIKDGSKVLVKKGTLITKPILEEIREFFENGGNLVDVKANKELDEYTKVQMIKVQNPKDKRKTMMIIGNDPTIDVKRLTISDIYASISYYLNLLHGLGNYDEIDHLSNRRVRQVGELLQNQFRIGVTRMERVIRDRMTVQDIEDVTPKSLVNIRPVTAAMKQFFGSSQLSQFMDQVNPASELTHKRRLSALGPGGLQRDRAGMDVRDVNISHYGRICPIESPEGPNIGLITTLSSYAKVNEYGFLMTPYKRVIDKKIDNEVVYFTADEETEFIIGIANVETNKDNIITADLVEARHKGENILVKPEDLDYVDVSPQQVVSVVTSLIPFIEHDDANRALMGSNMQRQAIPLLKPEAPFIGTGVEYTAARDSGAAVIAKADGIVEFVDSRKIIVANKKGKDVYDLLNFVRSNNTSCYHQRPIVKVGDKVKRGTIIADGPSMDQGELALGKNMTVAFMTFDGYNFEDAVILNERIVKDDVYTSIHIEKHEIQCRETKLGPEEITRDIPNVSEESRKNLDEDGIIIIGTEVKVGDILVGKVTPKGVAELSSEEKLLHAIFGEKTREVRDTSLRVQHGEEGIVHDVQIYTREDSDDLPAGVSKVIRVDIAQKRKIQVGDKMSGRHGNKGVVSLILPEEDMPYLPDGTPVDVLLNPQGVPSRMNIGQVLELHLGMAAKKLGVHVASPVFDGATHEDINEMLKEAKMDADGKTVLYDGRTGEAFENRISVGVMYLFKLNHMADDKLHARATGPYSLVTQQPLGGKAQLGGQRFGEMEVWAMYAYGAAHSLQELLTVKSDDVMGRVKVYESLVKGKELTQPGIPESFRVLLKELQGLGLDLNVIDDKDRVVSLKQLEEESEEEVIINNQLELELLEEKRIREEEQARLEQEKLEQEELENKEGDDE